VDRSPVGTTRSEPLYGSSVVRRLRPLALAAALVGATASPPAAAAQGPPCRPCLGVVTDSPELVAAVLGETAGLGGEARLYVAWTAVPGGGDDAVAAAEVVAAAGAVPWLRLQLSAPDPPASHLEALSRELEAVADLARRAPPRSHFELRWRPPDVPAPDPRAAAFVLKRAAVAIAGAAPEARVLAGGLVADASWLESLYGEDLGAYVDGLVFDDRPGTPGPATLAALAAAVDPGRPVVRSSVAPSGAAAAVAVAAADAAAGIAVTLFTLPDGQPPDLGAMVVAARELQGDLTFDPGTSPPGAWSFVRGSDLGLRLVVPAAAVRDGRLEIPDAGLRDPVLVGPDGEETPLRLERRAGMVVVRLPDAPTVAIVRLERMSPAELGGFGGQVAVADAAGLSVEEILSRLQASEDGQERRLRHWEAELTTHLRFRVTEGSRPIQVTFAGPAFRRDDGSVDWAWESLRVDGVRWQGSIPDLPLIQPERAAAMPLEIHFTPEYRYRLRGTETVAGRDCWVVEFEPATLRPGRSLYRGTVWIDREAYVRVQTRSLQLGLAGDVLSNEETVEFAPLDASGAPAAWSREAFVLPVRTRGQELQSILNTVILVEKESTLTGIRINRDGFGGRLSDVHAGKRTMVRDTPGGLRYLDRTEDGRRVVRTEPDDSSLFALAGTYYDETLDLPLPLGGVNWFTRDLRGTGLQANVFFAGAFVNANLAQPSVGGGRWDAGARLFGLFVPFEQQQFRDGLEVEAETLEHRPAQLDLFLGRALGASTRIEVSYGLGWDEYGRAEDTAGDFRVPADTFTHSLGVELSWNWSGWSVALAGAAARRDEWHPWGVPGSPGYHPSDQEYATWRASLTKSWWLSEITRIGVQLERLDGRDLDRFSAYDFGFFAGSRVTGYPAGLVTATEADGIHVSAGLTVGELLRLEARGDLVRASDDRTGLDRERLAGIGLGGTVFGPWQTLVTFDLGVAVDGPADSLALSVVFLKLF